MTKRIEGRRGKVEKIIACRVEQKGNTYAEIPGSEYEIPADMVILAMGFSGLAAPVLDAFGIEKDRNGNALAKAEGDTRFMTSVDGVFAAGDVRRRQSLVVWALHEGRECADAVNCFLMENKL